MPDPSRLALFVGAALLLLVVPGPSVLYIVTQSVSHGRRAGIVSVAGITTGTLVHILAATVGLSALLASSALAFDVVKYLGEGERGRGERAESPTVAAAMWTSVPVVIPATETRPARGRRRRSA